MRDAKAKVLNDTSVVKREASPQDIVLSGAFRRARGQGS